MVREFSEPTRFFAPVIARKRRPPSWSRMVCATIIGLSPFWRDLIAAAVQPLWPITRHPSTTILRIGEKI
jgi:hypothetical protein